MELWCGSSSRRPSSWRCWEALRVSWQSPLGRQFFNLGSNAGFEVVGVVGDTKIERLREPAKPLFYVPIAQSRDPDLVLVARGTPAQEEIAGMLRTMIREVNPDLMIMDAKTVEENVAVVLFPARMAALLLGVFGVPALTLATIGLAQLIRQVLYGVGPWDPLTLLGVPLLLGFVAAGAALIPALRASRGDPVEALRQE